MRSSVGAWSELFYYKERIARILMSVLSVDPKTLLLVQVLFSMLTYCYLIIFSSFQLMRLRVPILRRGFR